MSKETGKTHTIHVVETRGPYGFSHSQESPTDIEAWADEPSKTVVWSIEAENSRVLQEMVTHSRPSSGE